MNILKPIITDYKDLKINEDLKVSTRKQYIKIPFLKVSTNKLVVKTKDTLQIGTKTYDLRGLVIKDLISLVGTEVNIKVLNDVRFGNIPCYHIHDFTNRTTTTNVLTESPISLNSLVSDNTTVKAITHQYNYLIVDNTIKPIQFNIQDDLLYTTIDSNTKILATKLDTEFFVYFTDFINTEDTGVLDRGDPYDTQ